MHLSNIIPAALLLASVTANPVQNEERQLGGLSPLLGVIGQVLPVPGSAGSSSSGATTLPSAGSDVSAQASCDKAVQRINEAIQLSSALTSKNGGKATAQDVLIVLAVLQKSLGENCNVATIANAGSVTLSTSGSGRKFDTRDMASENSAADGGPLSGIIGSGNNPNGIIGDLIGGGRDDDDDRGSDSQNHDWDDNKGCAESDDPECADMYPIPPYYSGNSEMQGEDTGKVLQIRATTELSNCSACEAALYSIVKELQTLFESSNSTAIPSFGEPRLNNAVQRLRMEMTETTNEKRCDGSKC